MKRRLTSIELFGVWICSMVDEGLNDFSSTLILFDPLLLGDLFLIILLDKRALLTSPVYGPEPLFVRFVTARFAFVNQRPESKR